MAINVRSDKEVERTEEQKRQTVLTKPRKTVLIKILAMQGIKISELGLERKDRNDAAIDDKHTAEARKRDLDPKAYRSKTDTGYCLIEKGKYRGVHIIGILDQLRDLGLRYVSGHWQEVVGKGPVVFLNFNTEGEEITIPEPVEQILGRTFHDIVIWSNLRYNDSEDVNKGQYRLDTINVANPHISGEKSWQLIIPQDHPNTYRVV